MNIAHVPASAPSANGSSRPPATGPGDAAPSPQSARAPSAGPDKLPFRPPADVPTQSGPLGIRYDFNDGCRVWLPDSNGPYRVRLSDIDSGNVLFETEIKSGRINSTKRYFVRIRLEIRIKDEVVLQHDYAAADRDVLIQLPEMTLGDTIGWFPYADRFRALHGCRLTCTMSEKVIPLFRTAYPDVTLLGHSEVDPRRYYATYNIGLFFDDQDHVYQPCDFRHVGLHRTAGYILGVDPAEQPPRIAVSEDTPPLLEPYVCIAVQSTTQCKYWNNPHGSRETVRFLKQAGYRVICIDQKPVHGSGVVWTQIPHGAEDETGDRPLQERARWLKHAAFFVGLSSGLSWLAWATGTPVVLISGFAHPTNEFTTPYRVVNYHACNSCWNDPVHRFDHKDFLWCPRHKDTPRQFECTRLITFDQVRRMIENIPGFGTRNGNRTQ